MTTASWSGDRAEQARRLVDACRRQSGTASPSLSLLFAPSPHRYQVVQSDDNFSPLPRSLRPEDRQRGHFGAR